MTGGGLSHWGRGGYLFEKMKRLPNNKITGCGLKQRIKRGPSMVRRVDKEKDNKK